MCTILNGWRTNSLIEVEKKIFMPSSSTSCIIIFFFSFSSFFFVDIPYLIA
jgi:hypothetical protein